MALADEVTARYSDQELIELTNPEDGTATTINTTLLGYAVTDVQAEFEIRQIGEYDASDAKHVTVAVEGVLARLKTFARTGKVGGSGNDEWEWWIENRCKALAKVAGMKKVTAQTSTETTQSSELPDGVTTVRPWADSVRFRHRQVLPPFGVDASDDND